MLILCSFYAAMRSLEMVLKMCALGIACKDKGIEGESDDEARVRRFDQDDEGGYFTSGWNRFDAVVVVLSWVLIIVQEATENENIARLVSIFRIARPLRALRSFEGTQV